MRLIFALILSLLAATGARSQGQLAVTTSSTFPFQQMSPYGGGFVTRVNVNVACNIIVGRTDTYGWYLWNQGLSQWAQINTKARMPSANFGFQPANTSANQTYQGGPQGGYEIVSAPSDCTRGYAAMFGGTVGHVWPTTNGFGTLNTETDFYSACACNMTATSQGAGGAREDGPKMAVSPASADAALIGAQSNGVWATINGANWLRISTTAGSNGGIPAATEYAMAYDPADATGNTAYICASGSGVYLSIDAALGSASQWNLTTSGPTTCLDLSMAANTGVVVAVASDGTYWCYGCVTGGTWTHSEGSPGSSFHTVAVDPSSCGAGGTTFASCKIVLGQGTSGGTNMTASTNGGASWTAAQIGTRTCTNDVAWLCSANEFFMTTGNMTFDGLGDLWFGEGIGIWNTRPTYDGTTAWSWKARSVGIGNLVTFGNVLAPNGAALIAFEDRGYALVQNPTDYTNSGLFSLCQAINLCNSTMVDYAANNPCFVVAQIGPDLGRTFDWSGSSTDCGKTLIPFNSWTTTVSAATAICNNTSAPCGGTAGSGNLVRVVVPSTTGLTTWANGAGSIVTILQGGQTTNLGVSAFNEQSFEVTVVDATHIDLQNSTCPTNSTCGAYTTSGGTYRLYVATRPSSTLNGSLLVQAANNDGSGHCQLTVNTGYQTPPVNGTEVQVTGTTDCDGWFVTSGLSGQSVVLRSSVWSASPAWSGAGQIGAPTFTGGSLAALSDKTILRVPENDEYPYCSTDGGLTWADIGPLATGSPHYGTIASASWNGGTNVVTFVGNTPLNIQYAGGSDDKTFQVMGVNPSAYNAKYTATGNGGDATGKTVTATLVSNPGTYVSGGTLVPGGASQHGTGWGFSPTNAQHIATADRGSPGSGYMANYNVAQWYKVNPDCSVTPIAGSKVTPGSGWATVSNFNSNIVAVPGYTGHMFWAAGESGGTTGHPANVNFWRTCNGGSTISISSDASGGGFFEVWGFGFGAPASGKSYPALYVIGWYSPTNNRNTATFGVWQSVDDASSGTTCSGGTWQMLTDFPGGWQSFVLQFNSITGSLVQYGQVFVYPGNSVMNAQFPYLLDGDLHRGAPANDNGGSPAFLNRAA